MEQQYVKGKENEKVNKMNSNGLEDVKVDVRIILAALWISHFLLWTFGDMVAILQETTEPISNDLAAFVAAPLAVIQTLMIIFSLTGAPKWARLANLCVAPVYMLINIGYLAGSSEGWNYFLGIAYVGVTLLIIWHAWKWPTLEDGSAGTEN